MVLFPESNFSPLSSRIGASLTHWILVDSSTVICLMNPFVILVVSVLFCRFYSIS